MMKKWHLLLLLLSCNLAFGVPLQNRTLNSEAIKELVHIFGIAENADLVAETQKRWLRKAGQERWEMEELSLEQRCFVLQWAQEQGLFDAWEPMQDTYDQALILGATTSCMQGRFQYLIDLWTRGVRFQKVIWLTGERPLDARVDGLMDKCSTESEAARVLWETMEMPKDLRSLPVAFIEVPMQGRRRPTTKDTLVAYLQTNPNPCQALFVSDQPFCGYQFAILEGTLPSEFLFDLAGPGVQSTSHPSAAAIVLDTVARWMYQDALNQKGK